MYGYVVWFNISQVQPVNGLQDYFLPAINEKLMTSEKIFHWGFLLDPNVFVFTHESGNEMEVAEDFRQEISGHLPQYGAFLTPVRIDKDQSRWMTESMINTFKEVQNTLLSLDTTAVEPIRSVSNTVQEALVAIA